MNGMEWNWVNVLNRWMAREKKKQIQFLPILIAHHNMCVHNAKQRKKAAISWYTRAVTIRRYYRQRPNSQATR